MKNQLISQRLQVNAGIMAWYVKELTKMTEQMTKECKKEISEIYKKGYPQIAFDDSISSQTRIALNALYIKYGDKFDKRAKELVKTLLRRTNRYANGQINNAMKNMLAGSSQSLLRQNNFNCYKITIFPRLPLSIGRG